MRDAPTVHYHLTTHLLFETHGGWVRSAMIAAFADLARHEKPGEQNRKIRPVYTRDFEKRADRNQKQCQSALVDEGPITLA